jgi:3-dehydroquinate synthase
MQTVRVALGDRSYPVHIGTALLGRSDLLDPLLIAPRVALATNSIVGPQYGTALAHALTRRGIKVTAVTLPDGEASKRWESLQLIYDAMLRDRCDRRTTIIALGGGVVGDVAGFAAATFMRGVPFVQIPTTLLAQVDSSVGGKTAINHPLGKNMIGAFHQPVGVIADMDTLATLPDRELRAGLAEVIKHGLIRDPTFFVWLERNLDRLLARDRKALAHAVERSVEIKAAVVALDERETGPRALLNLGHTFGHAIEAALGFGQWLHGEAVGAGLVMAADLSARLGKISEQDLERVRAIVRRAGLPAAGPKLGADRYLELMSLDKKANVGVPSLVLINALGDAFIAPSLPALIVRQTLESAVE